VGGWGEGKVENGGISLDKGALCGADTCWKA